MNTVDEAIKYAVDVGDGIIAAGELIKLACERFLRDLKDERFEYKQDKVERCFLFINKLKHTTGEFAGKPFILSPWQCFVVANIVGFYMPDGSRRFTESYLQIARKNGKALSLDTPIPTPTGWTNMGELKVGDEVLDKNGLPTKVTFVTPVQLERTCYKVTFEDGEVITADAEHLWQIYSKDFKSKDDINKERTLVTKDMLNDFKRVRADGKGIEYQYRVPMHKALELPEKDLLLDPYILGLWLGDGTSSRPEFTVCNSDMGMYQPVINQFGDCKIKDKRNSYLTLSWTGDKGKNNSKLRHLLVKLNVLNNKHIPAEYLRASKEQRLALLQGLMDTDGTCLKNGQCEIQQKNKAISDGIGELLSSLGIKYSVVEKVPTINGKQCTKVYRISFFTDKNLPCFRLSRKADRLKDNLNKRMLYKSIINIEKIETVPVKCITVDNNDSLYLCGKRMTVTHNTCLSAAIALYFLVADGEGNPEVLLAANTREQAKIAFGMCNSFTRGIDIKGKHLNAYRDRVTFTKKDGFLKVVAADSGKLDGYNVSLGLLDEYHEAKDSGLFDVIKSSQAMRKSPHLMVITTAGFNLNGPCYAYRTMCANILHGTKQDENIFAAIYEMDEEDDWKDPENWLKCSPGYGVTVRDRFMKDQVLKATNEPSSEGAILTKTFNKWVSSQFTWIPNDYVLTASQNVNLNDYEGQQCWIGVDLSQNVDLTSVAYMVRDEDDKAIFKVDYYLPEESLKTVPNKDMYRVWARNGLLKLTPGNVVDYDYITNDILKYQDTLAIQGVWYDSWGATSWAIDAQGKGLNMQPFSQTLSNFNGPTKEMERLLLSKRAVFENNEITRFCFQNVVLKLDDKGNVKPDKAKSANKIDGVIAAIEALGGFLTVDHYSNDVTII